MGGGSYCGKHHFGYRIPHLDFVKEYDLEVEHYDDGDIVELLMEDTVAGNLCSILLCIELLFQGIDNTKHFPLAQLVDIKNCF